MGWLIGPLVTVLLAAVIGTGAFLSVVTTRKPTGGALERLDNNTATPQDLQVLQGAGQDFVRSAQILRAGGSLIGSRGPIPNIGGGAAGRIVGGQGGVLGGAGVGATPTGAESALGGVVNRAIGSLATQASRPAQTSDNPSTPPAGGAEVGSHSSTGQGVSGAGPDLRGAIEAGQTFQGQAPWGGGQTPTGPTQPGQPQPPSYTGTEPPPGAGPPGTTWPQPPPGYPPYPPYPCGYPGYPPCPPGYGPPHDPSVRTPWDALIPPPGAPKPPGKGPGPVVCPPGCHIKPGTNQCHCGGD